MSIDKRLISTAAAAPAGCTADTLNIFGDSSCVALYRLNYDGSDAGDNYNGTPTDVTFNAPGYIDYAASFNGSSSKFDTGYTFANTTFSVSVWFKTNDTTKILITNTSDSTPASNNDGFRIYTDRVVLTQDDINIVTRIFSSSLGDGDWHNIVITNNGSTLTTYIDGSAAHTDSSTSFTQNNTRPVVMGYQPRSTITQYLNGSIDQVRFFNKELSSSEVTTLYGEVACQYTCTTDTNGFPSTASSDLAAYWKFDNDATDETGSYNGTLNGTNTWVAGRYGLSYKSNGSSGYISTSLTLPSTNYAFSYWAYNNGADQQSIIGTEGSNVGISMRCRFATNQIAWNNWNVEAYEPTVSFKQGWNHVVQQISSNGKQIYLNGSLAASNSTTSITNNSNIGVRIGGYPPFSYFSSCPIDQIRYYTKALSSTEISAIYEEEHQCYITVDSTDPFGDGNNIALYKFENNANDSLGSYNGTASNVTYSTESIIGTYAGSFNGSNSTISLPLYNRGGNNNWSISAWVNIATNITGTIFGFFDGSVAYDQHLIMAIYQGKLQVGQYGSVAYSPTTIPKNQWVHLAFSRSTSNNARGYVNGELVFNTTFSTLNLKNEVPYIGSNYNNVSFFSGKIDQIRVFDRVINGDEMWKLYAEGAKG